MKRLMTLCCLLLAAASLTLFSGCASFEHHEKGEKHKRIQRYGSITGLKADKIAYYKELHAKPWPSVIRKLKECDIRNYSIYLKEIEGQPFLFSYFEYTGKDFAKDMAKMAADPETQRWWKETDPCQQPLPEAVEKQQIWTSTEEVFHTDGAAKLESPKLLRVGTITGLKPEKEAWYRTLHQTPWPQVNEQIKQCKIRNYSIYLKDINGKLYLFSYFEYLGDDLAADGANMAKDAVTQRWWQQTDPCQIPFPAAAEKKTIWDGMEEVFHME